MPLCGAALVTMMESATCQVETACRPRHVFGCVQLMSARTSVQIATAHEHELRVPFRRRAGWHLRLHPTAGFRGRRRSVYQRVLVNRCQICPACRAGWLPTRTHSRVLRGKPGPLEPAQRLLCQWHSSKIDTPIQTRPTSSLGKRS